MTPQEAENLLARYVAQQCTQDEENLVNSWFNKVVRETDYTVPILMNGNAMSEDWERIVAERRKWIPAHKNRTRNVVRAVSVAATVAIVIGGLFCYNLFTKVKEVDIAAIQDTTISHQNGYFKTVMPDGTVVYLNIESKISYPKGLKGKERRVVLEGEAEFIVSPDKARPFIVNCGEQEVHVLGTHFNIRSNKGEPIRTTLLEGAVKLTNTRNKQQDVLLKPGFQATLSTAGFDVKKVDPKSAISWRSDFVFNQTPLRDALKEMARWYDVGVDSSRITSIPLEAVYSKDEPLPSLLKEIAQSTNLKLVLKNNVITVE
jgi:ferric-dicitrate binding protein FerR (iron transport regulator)